MRNRYTSFLLFIFFLVPISGFTNGAWKKKYSASEIQLMLKKLNVLGSVLYVAAHPDDENTQLISYYANDKLYRTAYLSATRGDGGQNLIGPQLREKLGIIRTHELIEARKVDGGMQFFSRANDFGYSKHPDETFEIWDKEKILADFVWVIRKFRPDIIVTRFSEKPGVTHGHHTAASLLAKEAFSLAADPNAFTEQLNQVDTWQAKRLLWNSSPWFYRITGEKFDPSRFLKVDVGTYNSLIGFSHTEIAALSRSKHKSQGFGTTGSRGEKLEYLEFLYGDSLKNGIQSNEMEGVDVTWDRVTGGDQVKAHLQEAYYSFDPENPEGTVDHLILALIELDKLEDGEYWKEVKKTEVLMVIRACMGLYMEAKINTEYVSAGVDYEVNLELTNRSGIDLTWESYSFSGSNDVVTLDKGLKNNIKYEEKLDYSTEEFNNESQPYWLREKATLGYYNVTSQYMIGKPENDPVLFVEVGLKRNGYSLKYELPVIHKFNDPVKGEVYRNVHFVPPVSVRFDQDVVILTGGSPKKITLSIASFSDQKFNGRLQLDLPEGWKSDPTYHEVSFQRSKEQKKLSFELIPSNHDFKGEIKAFLTSGEKTFHSGVSVIDYAHIGNYVMMEEAKAKLMKFDLKSAGQRIGYIKGAGDNVAEAIQTMGYTVIQLAIDEINADRLKGFDAVVLGIRAYNTVPELSYLNKVLFDYAKNGGTVIVQYNTSHRLVTDNIAPGNLKLSRNRVTMEDSPVTVIHNNHPILQYPNKVDEGDFNGWVQERGLYFPSEWDDTFKTVLSSHDKNEPPLEGGILCKKHGKGYYIYTSYSWFRQLPAGVSGAYKLFANMLSIGK